MTDLAQLELRIRSLEVIEATRNLAQFQQAGAQVEQRARSMVRETDALSRSALRVDSSFRSALRSILPVTAAIVGLQGARSAISAVSSIESGLVGIAKTADVAESQMGALESRFDQLGTSLSTPIDQLFQIGQVAGQLGVRGVDDIGLFTETVAKLADAAPSLRANVEQAALSLAKIIAVTGEGTGIVDELASVIVLLGNNFETLESRVIDTGVEVAKAGAVFGVTASQSVALAAAFDRIGTEAELSRSAVGRVFALMDKAIAQTGPELERFASISGKSGTEFAQIFKTDAVEALRLFVNGLGDLANRGQSTNLILAGLGVESRQLVPTIQSLAKNAGVLNTILAASEAEFRNATELEKEFARGADTLRAALGRLSNTNKIFVEGLLDDSTGIAGGFRAVVEVGTDALRILGAIEGETAKAGTGAHALAIAIKVLGGSLVAIGASKAVSLLASLRTEAGLSTLGLATLAGGVGALVGSLTDLGTGFQVAAGLALAIRLAPLGEQALLAARRFTALQVAVRAGLAPGLEASRQQAVAARAVAAADVEKTTALLANIRAQRAALPITLATARASAASVATEQVRTTLTLRQVELEGQLAVQQAALAASNTAVATTSAAAAVSTTAFGRALITVRTAMVGVGRAIAANPITAIAVGASIVIPILIDLVSKLKQSSKAVDELGKSQESLAGALESIARAQAAQRLALSKNDTAGTIQGIQDEIEGLKELQLLFEILREKRRDLSDPSDAGLGKAVTVATLVSLDPNNPLLAKKAEDLRVSLRDALSGALIKAIEESAATASTTGSTIFASLTDKILEEVARVSESGIEGVRPGELESVLDLERLEDRLRGFSTETLNLFVQFKKALGDLALTDEERAALTESFAKVFDPAVLGASLDEGIDVAETRAVELQRRLEELQASSKLTQGAGGRTVDQEAVAGLDELEAKLRLESDLAGRKERGILLTREQIDIERQLAEIRKAAEAAGLSPDEVNEREKRFRALLQEAAASEEARKAQEDLTKSRKDAQAELREFLLSASQEARLAGLSVEAREQERAAIDARTIAAKIGIDGIAASEVASAAELAVINALVAGVKEDVRVRQEREAAVKAGVDAQKKTTAEDKKEVEALRGLRQEMSRLTTEVAIAQAEQEGQAGGLIRLAAATRAFREEADEVIQVLEKNRDVSVRAATSDAERTEAMRQFEAAVESVNQSVSEFSDNLSRLAAATELNELVEQARDLGRAFDEFFLTDRDIGITRSLRETQEAAERLRAVLKFRLEIGQIDTSEFEDASRSIDEFVAGARAELEKLADLAQIRDAARGISDAFGTALEDVVLGTSSVRDAAVALVQDISQALFRAFVTEPLTQKLTAKITEALAGASELESGASALSAPLEDAASAAGLTLTAGGESAGAALIKAAGTAASILGGASASSGALGALGGAFGGFAPGGGVATPGSNAGAFPPIPTSVFVKARGGAFAADGAGPIVRTFARGGVPSARPGYAPVLNALPTIAAVHPVYRFRLGGLAGATQHVTAAPRPLLGPAQAPSPVARGLLIVRAASGAVVGASETIPRARETIAAAIDAKAVTRETIPAKPETLAQRPTMRARVGAVVVASPVQPDAVRVVMARRGHIATAQPGPVALVHRFSLGGFSAFEARRHDPSQAGRPAQALPSLGAVDVAAPQRPYVRASRGLVAAGPSATPLVLPVLLARTGATFARVESGRETGIQRVFSGSRPPVIRGVIQAVIPEVIHRMAMGGVSSARAPLAAAAQAARVSQVSRDATVRIGPSATVQAHRGASATRDATLHATPRDTAPGILMARQGATFVAVQAPTLHVEHPLAVRRMARGGVSSSEIRPSLSEYRPISGAARPGLIRTVSAGIGPGAIVQAHSGATLIRSVYARTDPLAGLVATKAALGSIYAGGASREPGAAPSTDAARLRPPFQARPQVIAAAFGAVQFARDVAERPLPRTTVTATGGFRGGVTLDRGVSASIAAMARAGSHDVRGHRTGAVYASSPVEPRVLLLARGGAPAAQPKPAPSLPAAAGSTGRVADLLARSFSVAPAARGFRGGLTLDRGTSASIAAIARAGSPAVRAHARGTIVDRPTLLPQALIGEGSRPEAVLPLAKGSTGILGVMAQVHTQSGFAQTSIPLKTLPDGNLGVRFSRKDIERTLGGVRLMQHGGVLDEPDSFFSGNGGPAPVFGSDTATVGAHSGRAAGADSGSNGTTLNMESTFNFKITGSGATPDVRRGIRRAVRQEAADARRLLRGNR